MDDKKIAEFERSKNAVEQEDACECGKRGVECCGKKSAESHPEHNEDGGCCDSCVEEKISSLSGQLLRLQAEFDNYKKRTAKEKEALSAQSEAKFMLRLLPIYEELGLAENEANKVKDAAVRDGVVMVLSKLRAAFGKEGLSEMRLEGEKFDPFRHETAMREDSDAPEGTIVRVIQKGYLFRGEMLRHAIVSVSSGKKPEEKKKGEAGEEKD
ncbi:MAG: nucleotide exchange factor GrpE [Candidatus Micrarchaeia archaeon]